MLMMKVEEIVVISDLHLAARRGEGLFQSDEQLAGFLKWIHEETRHCLLVLNGDVLDFLVDGDPKTITDAKASASQAASIIEHHTEVFDALAGLANSPDHQLLIVGGNHDPEWIFPEVQQEIAHRLKGTCSHPPARWAVNGEAVSFYIGAAKVLIEHGDQYDDFNFIDHESLRKMISLNSRGIDSKGTYKPPPGSHVVINRFNLIRDSFPWVERLHPLGYVVLPLILEVVMPQLERKEQIALLGVVKEVAQWSKRSAIKAALRSIKPESKYWADEDEERQRFIEWQAEFENQDMWGRAEQDFAGIIKRLRNVSARDGFFEIEERDGAFEAMNSLIGFGNRLVIHGHTHAAKAYRVGRGLYLNSGTWGQLMRLPESEASDEEWIEFVKSLARGEADSFSRPTFIRVTAQGESPRARLCEWKEGAPETMSAWRFEQDEREWNQGG